MRAAKAEPWYATNHRYLTAALDLVREALEGQPPSGAAQSGLDEAGGALPAASALEALSSAFGLSPFERNVVLLCAGRELDPTFAARCAAAHDDAAYPFPTFNLAMARLPGAHWSAVTPDAPLRRWRLVRIGPGDTLMLSPLRVDERVLHYLLGLQHFDERFAGVIELLGPARELVGSHRECAERVAAIWSRAPGDVPLPVIQLRGDDAAGNRAIAAEACSTLGLRLGVMSAHDVPATPGDLDGLARLWEREAVLSHAALLVECGEHDAADTARERAIVRFVESARSPIIVSGREHWRAEHRLAIRVETRRPTPREQRGIWRSALGEIGGSLDGELDAVVSQFSLGARTIHAAAAEALGSVADGPEHRSDSLGAVLWDACRTQARTRLDALAQHIEPAARWEDLVLPDPQCATLRAIASHVRQRAVVYESWGFATQGARGLGISALFTGTSGTGKTMAAEILAGELRLDLYRIDLSQVVSKYVGETEKNLRRVFDAAEEGGAILLFDEADALFGKRSEVKDSHDRFANIEVSYLLQRMETYRGLAILTTNLKNAIDAAFLRRIRFVVQFPFPDAASRAEIWRRIFPASTPTEGLDVEKLARLNVAGGNIRNIAMNAAFLAADAGEHVGMRHLLRAARAEFAKLEKPIADTEVAGWI